jgi:Superfamily I DNA and RNA helicases
MSGGIILTEEQEKLVRFQPSGNLLIRGEPGSGKTTVLSARAKWIDSLLSNGRLLFVTYNAALVRYVRSLLDSAKCANDVTVSTFHDWCRDFARKLGVQVGREIKAEEREAYLKEILKELGPKWSGNHLACQPISFWSQEIEWIFGQGISTLEDYCTRPRTGRGTAVQVRGDDRKFVWEVFERYINLLESRGEHDIDNPAGLVRKAVEKNNGLFPESLQYDHVFVDEVQDFDLSWLLVLSPVAKVSLTLAGDLGQRIYRRYFTWKAAGIDVRGARSQRLTGTFRTTRQIMQVATYVATNYDLQMNEDYIPPSIPNRDGPKVAKIERTTWWQAQEAAARRAAELARTHPNDTVVLAVQFNRQLDDYCLRVRRQGCPADVAKGMELLPAPGKVIVTTYYQLKGLEFDHVVLTGLEDETMPEYYYSLPDSELPAEKEQYLRRLVYVAMTRAKKSVTLAGGSPFCRFFNDVPAALFEML